MTTRPACMSISSALPLLHSFHAAAFDIVELGPSTSCATDVHLMPTSPRKLSVMCIVLIQACVNIYLYMFGLFICVPSIVWNLYPANIPYPRWKVQYTPNSSPRIILSIGKAQQYFFQTTRHLAGFSHRPAQQHSQKCNSRRLDRIPYRLDLILHQTGEIENLKNA